MGASRASSSIVPTDDSACEVFMSLSPRRRLAWRSAQQCSIRRDYVKRDSAIPVKRAIPSTAYLTSMDRQAAGRDTRDTE
jgi:hypothetical protein